MSWSKKRGFYRIMPRDLKGKISWEPPWVVAIALELARNADDDGSCRFMSTLMSSSDRRGKEIVKDAVARLVDVGFLQLTDGGQPVILDYSPFKADEKKPAQRSRTGIGNSVRFDVLAAHGFACRYCGRRAPLVDLHIEHVVPVAKGGRSDRKNLVAACMDCNAGKGTKLISLEEM